MLSNLQLKLGDSHHSLPFNCATFYSFSKILFIHHSLLAFPTYASRLFYLVAFLTSHINCYCPWCEVAGTLPSQLLIPSIWPTPTCLFLPCSTLLSTEWRQRRSDSASFVFFMWPPTLWIPKGSNFFFVQSLSVQILISTFWKTVLWKKFLIKTQLILQRWNWLEDFHVCRGSRTVYSQSLFFNIIFPFSSLG